MQPPDKGEHNTDWSLECDSLDCCDPAAYCLEAHWPRDESIPLYVCLVHVPWGFTQLQAFRVRGAAPLHLAQFPLWGLA